jgi:hypothetical protein
MALLLAAFSAVEKWLHLKVVLDAGLVSFGS